MYGTSGHYAFPPHAYGNTAGGQGNVYSPAAQWMSNVGYQGFQHHDNSPASQHWTPTAHGPDGVPTLITPRRDSISSNENDQPATPSFAAYPGWAAGGVAINRTPSGVFTHGTPSPTSLVGPYGLSAQKQVEQNDVSPRLKMLVSREPAIPRAIPAPSSPLKPLDRALENQRGETNVYIRGLLPETTDEMLEIWGTRFGDIKSSKSIIDLNTGLCKGFGFVKYHNYEDAENCIRGFHYLGYEVSFARESFYSKLKTFADEANTNLYVSNLPKSMNEHELGNLFAPHKECFDSRHTCDEVIKTFNNHAICSGGEDLQMQIRFADTQEQKALKQQTQAARQFRSAEYEFATQQWRQGRLPYAGATANDNGQGKNNEFEQYLGTSGVPIQGQKWAQSGMTRQSTPRSPYVNNGQQQPVVQINVTSGAEDETCAMSDGSAAKPVVSPAMNLVDSAANSEKD
ncbi:RNA-binding domain-containing protein [Polychaeton citri CBS 116435]|uniref:RNA-binding domain-containing protein n=1 Tax=Polychaeton citri CBS 116435 TaxID=1314669 RepID=A0A9P4QBG8_9PEZI|nr:RNA-binding domain-containing protein [Polychaeton citri CBS 116435]